MNVENTELSQSPIDMEQVLSQLVESCPLSDLLETRLEDLKSEELDSFIDKARMLHESPASLKKFLRQGDEKVKRKPKAKINLDML